MIPNLKVLKNGEIVDAFLTKEESSSPWIRLIFDGFDSGIIRSEKLYFCLQSLHKQLDQLGIKLLCNGCRRDVRPSRMAISMGHGTRAYRHYMGKQATELVNIFEPTDELEAIASIEEQKIYFRDWLISIGWDEEKANSVLSK